MNMETLQFDGKWVAISSMVLSIASLVLVGVAFMCPLEFYEKPVKFIKHVMIEYKRKIFRDLCFIALTGFVLINWNTCISMQFFKEFNGNNILFILWITLMFLNAYKVKINNVEVFRFVDDETKKLGEDFQNANSDYQDEKEELDNKVEQDATNN